MLSPQALLARLETSLSLLSYGSSDLPERQQTMRNAITWSYNLLAEPEQRLFRRLALFSNGWTLEAMEAVCADNPTDTSYLLNHLLALIDKSLVVAEETADGESRFRLLRLIQGVCVRATDGGPRGVRHTAASRQLLPCARRGG